MNLPFQPTISFETNTSTSRRKFIRQSIVSSATLSVPWIIPGTALGKNGAVAPSDRITFGVIGIGPRCKKVLRDFLGHTDAHCMAIADVQATRREAGKAMVDEHYGNQDCQLYRDFRELLQREDLDAMLVATGDRWHAAVSILAAKAGKDVYSEKPCGITIADCQQLANTMDQTRRVFQAGTQRRSVPNFAYATKIAHSGRLGKIHTLHASVYVPKLNTTWLPGKPTPDPDAVDWNMWLGPAPWRPYHPDYVKGRWRGYYDFDSGATLLDWGAHTVDLCQWAAEMDDTMPIEYIPSGKNIIAKYANSMQLIMHFLPTPFDRRPGWFQHLSTCPVRFEGEEGWVEVGDSGGMEVSESIKDVLDDMPEIVNGLGVKEHSRNFLDCIKSREAPAANQTVMRHSHIACHAAATAWILNRNVKLDPNTEYFVDDPEANGLRSRPARDWASQAM